MLIYSFITDYQAFSLRYKDNTTRDKNETKVGKQSANLGKNNEPIQNRLSFLIDCKSVTLHHLTILSFPMVRPAWDNWWILQMSMALGALFSIIVAGGLAYKMMVKNEPIDVFKIMKVLGIALVMCFWYPPSMSGIGGNSNASILDALAYIPNCIGSYTHDLYEAEAEQVSSKYNELAPLLKKRDEKVDSIAPEGKITAEIIKSAQAQDVTNQVQGAESTVKASTSAQRLADKATFSGIIVGLDKIVMFLSLVIYKIGWWSTIFCQQILLGMLTIFGPIQWAFSVLPKWESSWAKWLTRYLTIEEIKKVMNTPCGYELVKKAFLFSCFTGLRYSDMKALNWSEIHKAADGKTEYIDHIQVKTKDRVTIPLSEETKKWMPKREEGIDNIFHNLTITSTTVEVVLKECIYHHHSFRANQAC
jgi:hypothetical protein